MPRILSPREQYNRALRLRRERLHRNPRQLAAILKERRIVEASAAAVGKKGRRQRANEARREAVAARAAIREQLVKPSFE